jgi:hypothetical protein
MQNFEPMRQRGGIVKHSHDDGDEWKGRSDRKRTHAAKQRTRALKAARYRKTVMTHDWQER